MTHSEDGDPRDFRRAAEAWLKGDPDEITQSELRAILQKDDDADLAERFARTLEFGTAGLRALLGAGPNRMNRAVVIRTSWGLAEQVLHDVPDAAERGIVIGHDARRLSREFAEDAAGVFAAAGLRVHWFAGVVPTPLLAFAVRFLRAAGGVMVTASHNAADYNGYKVYGPGGAQIVPPVDERIARAIAEAAPANTIARVSLDAAGASGRLVVVPGNVESSYVDGVKGLLLAPSVRPPLSIVYTPLHGVGWSFVRRTMAACGFATVTAVPEQAQPDPAFPTTPFPNPEEPGVLDRALRLARERDADLVIANDPDADRLAAAVKDDHGTFVQLTGNQVGVILGHYLLTEDRRPEARVVVTTIVSSPMLGEVAERLGAHCDETLTGFKWIALRATELAAEGKRFVFGYEEALGYTVGELVGDKDGIGAAALFAEVAAVCKERGSTVLAYLEELYRRFGLYASAQGNVIMAGNEGVARIRGLMKDLRAAPPARIGDRRVLHSRDYALGVQSLPPSDVLSYDLEGNTRVVIRPSGTEPKLKFYLDHREKVEAGEAVAQAELRVGREMARLEQSVRELVSG